MEKYKLDPNKQNVGQMTSILKDEDTDILNNFAQFVQNVGEISMSNEEKFKSLKDRIECGTLYKKIMITKFKLSLENFDLLKVLGQGAFGKVLLAEHKETEISCAIKVLFKKDVIESNNVESTMVERRILELGTASTFKNIFFFVLIFTIRNLLCCKNFYIFYVDAYHRK